MKLSKELRNIEYVKEKIELAREFVREKEVPLTVERIAVFLGVSREWFIRFIEVEDVKLKKKEREIRDILVLACEEAAADNVENGLTKGSSQTLNVLMLKNNHGYTDRLEQKEKEEKQEQVIFSGEEEIKD